MKRSGAYLTPKLKKPKSSALNKLTDTFFNNECVQLAKSLLGKKLVRQSNGVRLACEIVEVESYLANDDKSSHSFKQKRTKRNEAMFMAPGTLYVYTTYGMYHCMNISSKGDGDAVLIRSAEPIEGIEEMLKNREKHSKSSKPPGVKNLCNGPSKLCQVTIVLPFESKVFKCPCSKQALDITMEHNKLDLLKSEKMWVEDFKHIVDDQIVCAKRIGLNEKTAGEWADKLLRFYTLGNAFVSRKDLSAETQRDT